MYVFLFQGKFVVENVPGGVLIGNQTLVLQNVRRDQAGLYTCVVSNTEGDGESNAQYLNVKCKGQERAFLLVYSAFPFAVIPQCRSSQRLTYGAARRTTAQISCYVDANPNPTRFRWKFRPRAAARSASGGRKKAESVDVPVERYGTKKYITT